MVIARKQILVQLSDELVDQLDGEASRRGISRSALIREAVTRHLSKADEAELVRQYVESYRRFPQTEEEMAGAERGAIDAIREEPW